MKKVIIIGAGISGLTAGIYAMKNGYQAEIYEMHSIAGGECTGWDRGAYHFDGCIHWLLGSKPGTVLNDIWRTVGALDDTVRIINHDELGRFELDGRTLVMYRDLSRLEQHLVELSPQDKVEIRKLCQAIQAFQQFEIPTKKPFDMMNMVDGVKLLLRMRPVLRYMKYAKIDMQELSTRFDDPLIRRALTSFMLSEYSALAFLSTVASMAAGDSGWPEGGSRQLAERVQHKYRDLNGKIFFNKKVEKILIENGVAKGIRLVDGTEVKGDAVITATDGYEALFGLLEGKYLSEHHRTMYAINEDLQVFTSFQVWAGVAVDLSHRPVSNEVELAEPLRLGGVVYNRLWLKTYCFDSSMAPLGHSVISCFFQVKDFDWWASLYQDKGAYRKEKERIALTVRQAIENQWPETKGLVKQMDVATPMTYVRYCNAWRGSWMAWPNSPRLKVRTLPMRLKGLKNLVMASQWIMPPGGLPTALITGKWAVQHLCAADRKPFME